MSLAEVVVSTALFSLLLVVLYALMRQAINIWHNVSGSETALLRLKQVQRRLEADLVEASAPQSLVGKTPASLPGGGRDGSAVWFLSAGNESGRVVQKLDGAPLWQRNVLYYQVVPAGHTGCAGGVGARGFEDCCPHKLLVRKEIDLPATPALPEEVLLTSSEIMPYLTRPNGTDTSAMLGEPNVVRAELIATDMLWFEVTRPTTGEFHVDLRAVALEDARRQLSIGAESLAESRFTVRQPVSVFPAN